MRRMSTRNYDSQLITKRLQDKVNAQFVSQVSAAKQSIQRPLLSTPTQSFVNEVVSGGMTTYAKSEGIMLRDVGACCVVSPASSGTVDVGVGGSA